MKAFTEDHTEGELAEQVDLSEQELAEELGRLIDGAIRVERAAGEEGMSPFHTHDFRRVRNS